MDQDDDNVSWEEKQQRFDQENAEYEAQRLAEDREAERERQLREQARKAHEILIQDGQPSTPSFAEAAPPPKSAGSPIAECPGDAATPVIEEPKSAWQMAQDRMDQAVDLWVLAREKLSNKLADPLGLARLTKPD